MKGQGQAEVSLFGEGRSKRGGKERRGEKGKK